MIEELRVAIVPGYPCIRARHFRSAAIWSFSTAVAWTGYLESIRTRVLERSRLEGPAERLHGAARWWGQP